MNSRSWTPWQIDRPDRLPGYAHPDLVADLLPGGSPGRTNAAQASRTQRVYDAIASARITYCQPIEQDGFQQLLTPYEVLRAPKNATCIDVALVFSAAALNAGLQPKIVLVGGGNANHAVVLVWLGGNHAEADPPPLESFDSDEVRSSPTSAGSWMPIDPTLATIRTSGRGTGTFDDAVAAAFNAMSKRPWLAVVDVGADRGLAIEQPPTRPTIEPVLDDPYAARPQPPNGDRSDLGFRLELIKSGYDMVPFRRRLEYELLRAALDKSADETRLQVALVAGVGGAGKTRLLAELCHHQRDHAKWQTGWLPGRLRDPLTATRARLDWLVGTGSPLVVAIDYAEGRVSEVEEAIDRLAKRRVGPTWLLLSARQSGAWFDELSESHRRQAAFHEVVELPEQHSRPDELFGYAVTAFASAMGTNVPADPQSADLTLAWPTRRPTTLDIVMAGWLCALENRIGALPDRDQLYGTVLGHEQRLWAEIWRDRYREARGELAEAERAGLRLAAALLTCVGPTADQAEQVLRAASTSATGIGLTNRAERMAEVLATGMLAGDGTIGLRPDPIADHLISDELTKTPAALERLLTDYADDAVAAEAILRRVTRSGQTERNMIDGLAHSVTNVLAAHDSLWGPALAVAATDGGVASSALVAALTKGAELPIDLDALIDSLPNVHYGLQTVRAAALRQLSTVANADDPVERRAERELRESVALARAGDRLGAFTAGAAAVNHYRELADTNPAAFLPDLAASLNNLGAMLSETGDRAGALRLFDDVIGDMGSAPNAAAYLHAAKARFLADLDDPSSATQHLVQGCELLDPATPSPLRREAKRLIRSTAIDIASNSDQLSLGAELPRWCLAPIGDDLVELLNDWREVAQRAGEGLWLRERADEIAQAVDAGGLEAISATYDGDLFLERCDYLANAIPGRGIAEVAERLDRSGVQTDIVRRWIQTGTWIESEQFYSAHRVELAGIDPGLADRLDPQHGAILRLCRVRPIDEAFELARSPAQGAVAALDAVATGDDDLLVTILQASPGVSNQPGAGPVALAAAIIASGRDNLPDELVTMVRATSSPAIRPLLQSRLEALQQARPERSEPIARLLAALED